MKADITKKFEYNDWEGQWDGNWPILSFYHWGPFYSKKPFVSYIDQYARRTIIIWRNGRSSAYQRHSEKEIFAKKIIKLLEKDKGLVSKICGSLEKKTDIFLEFVARWENKDINLKQYREYQNKLLSYYEYHIQTKVSVDYLPPEMLDKFFPRFEKARVYAEPVFSKTIGFINSLSEIHAKKTGYPAEFIRAMMGNEFEKYLEDGVLPKKEILSERNKTSAYLFAEGKTASIIIGKDVKKIEKIVAGGEKTGLLKGTIAYGGKARGKVVVITDPKKAKGFKKGNILVSGMTRPEYMPLIKKAAAFVTDSGGILCHAAIVARELKKPCIIGTRIATKVLKDGDLVEVDADKGVVKIIK